MRDIISELSSKTGLKLFLKKINKEATEYNIGVYGWQTLYQCDKCKKKYLFSDECCGTISKIENQVHYAIGHIQIYDDIAYWGGSFENILGVICETMQYGGWGYFPLAIEKRKIVVTNLSNKCCMDIYKYFKVHNFNISFENKRVSEYWQTDNLVFGFDIKASQILIYDGYTSRINKISEDDMEKILSLWSN